MSCVDYTHKHLTGSYVIGRDLVQVDGVIFVVSGGIV
jgi:hypothetical protein